jgi:CheY-like chemotaxis protein
VRTFLPQQFNAVLAEAPIVSDPTTTLLEERAMSSVNGQQPVSASRRILVVEDNPEGREMLCLLLQVWGHEVEGAADGLQGVEKGLAWKPEIAVVDIGLPVLDGYQVARRLRAALHDQIRLIALTGYCQSEDRERAFEAGFDVHMCKPADLDELSRLLA